MLHSRDSGEGQNSTRTYDATPSMDATQAPQIDSRGTRRDGPGGGEFSATGVDAVVKCERDTTVGKRPQQIVNSSPQDSPPGGENDTSGSAVVSPPTTAISASKQRKERNPAANIVIFGETGVGKSSVINLIANETLAHTSNDAVGCTFRYERYPISLGNTLCSLWDTVGLDEGSEGTVPAEEAESNLKELIQELAHSGGIHLVIYCIRGTRLTRALKRNYDLFYGAACRRKVPVALVVTGLEHQQDGMESWWIENEAELRRNGMLFDAHACITTLNALDDDIQQRCTESRTLLCELIVQYSALPAWETHSSLLSLVLPQFQATLRGRPAAGRPKRTATTRKVIICGAYNRFFPATTTRRGKAVTATFGSRRYELIQVDKHAVDKITPVLCAGVGLLLFCSSSLVDNQLTPADVEALKKFYDLAGGQDCPVIVALEDCSREEVARACQVQVTSRHRDIKAHFVAIPSSNDVGAAPLGEMIDILCLEQVDNKAMVL